MNLNLLIRTHLAMLIAAGIASAQVPEVVHTLQWSEVQAGTTTPVPNPNGLLEPGEAALVTLSVSFTPVGTSVSYWGGTAPVAGYRASGFKLNAIEALGGTWTHFSVPPGFLLFPPVVGNQGELNMVSTIQEWQPHPWMPQTQNPFPAVWQGVWTPPSYTPRETIFTMAPIQPIASPPLIVGTVYVFNGSDYAYADAVSVLDSVQIPVVPTPGALGVFAGAIILLARKRRR